MSILTSHKNGIVYYEYTRIVASDTRLSAIKAEGAIDKYFAIPHANLSVLLLGPGTSITQAAAKMLSKEGVMFGFTSGGGTPLFLASQSEYRPTEYLQKWISWWCDEEKRIKAARSFQLKRISTVKKLWPIWLGKDIEKSIDIICNQYEKNIEKANEINAFLGYEGAFSKALYALLSSTIEVKKQKREPRKGDDLNDMLDHGNYLAYGLASVTLWALGIPPSLAVIHGKTRRGALVFDVADIIKDAIVMPTAFEAAREGLSDSNFRGLLIDRFDKSNAINILFAEVKLVADQ